MPSALCRGGKGSAKPYTSSRRPDPAERRAERSRAAQLGDHFGARSRGSPRSPFERDTPRVGAASQPTPDPSEAAGRGWQPKAPSSAERGGAGEEQERQLLLQTLREARRVVPRVPLQKPPRPLSWPVPSAPGPAPRGKAGQGGGWQHARGLGRGGQGSGSVCRSPPSAPRVSGAPRSRRRPAANSPDRGPLPHPWAAPSASAPRPPLTQVAAPQPGRVLQPEGPFPHVPQQVWAGATPRHGSAAGWEGSPPRGEGPGEGTCDQPPSRTGTIRAPGLAGGRSDSEGGGAFAPEARTRRGRSSAHTLPRLARTSRSATAPPSASRRGRGRRRRRPRLRPLPALDPSLQAFSRDDDHPGDGSRSVRSQEKKPPSSWKSRFRPLQPNPPSCKDKRGS